MQRYVLRRGLEPGKRLLVHRALARTDLDAATLTSPTSLSVGSAITRMEYQDRRTTLGPSRYYPASVTEAKIGLAHSGTVLSGQWA